MLIIWLVMLIKETVMLIKENIKIFQENSTKFLKKSMHRTTTTIEELHRMNIFHKVQKISFQ